MEKLTKKRIIVAASVLGTIAEFSVLLWGVSIPIIHYFASATIQPIVRYDKYKPETWLYLNSITSGYVFGHLRNYFVQKNTLNLLPLKKISSINSNAFVGVSKNDLEQIQSVVMPEHEINLGIDSLNKKNALNYLPNLQNIYISKNQNPSQYKEIGFSDKIKFWN